MKISFHGIKNAAGVYYGNSSNHMTKNGTIPGQQYNTLHIVATNENGKDLDKLKPILKTFPNRVNPDALDLTLDEFYTGYSTDTEKVYGINEDMVNLNRATLPFFVKIQEFLERVGKMNVKENNRVENFNTTKEAFYAFRRHYEPGCDNEFKRLIKDIEESPESGIVSAE